MQTMQRAEKHGIQRDHSTVPEKAVNVIIHTGEVQQRRRRPHGPSALPH